MASGEITRCETLHQLVEEDASIPHPTPRYPSSFIYSMQVGNSLCETLQQLLEDDKCFRLLWLGVIEDEWTTGARAGHGVGYGEGVVEGG